MVSSSNYNNFNLTDFNQFLASALEETGGKKYVSKNTLKGQLENTDQKSKAATIRSIAKYVSKNIKGLESCSQNDKDLLIKNLTYLGVKNYFLRNKWNFIGRYFANRALEKALEDVSHLKVVNPPSSAKGSTEDMGSAAPAGENGNGGVSSKADSLPAKASSAAASEPVSEPVIKPKVEPVSEPVSKPAIEPVIEPTVEPTVKLVKTPIVWTHEYGVKYAGEIQELEKLAADLQTKADEEGALLKADAEKLRAKKEALLQSEGEENQKKQQILQDLDKEGVRFLFSFSDRLKEEPSLLADHAFILAAVGKVPYLFSLPQLADFKSDRTFMMAYLKDYPGKGENLSEKLRKDPVFMLALLEKKDGKDEKEVVSYADSELCKNPAFMLAIADKVILWSVSEELLSDPAFILAALKRNPSAVNKAAAQLKEDPEFIKEAIVVKPLLKEYFNFSKGMKKDFYKDPAFVVAMAKQDASLFADADKALQEDRGVVIAAVQSNGLVLQFALTRFKEDLEIAKAAISQDVKAFDFIGSVLRKKVADALAKSADEKTSSLAAMIQESQKGADIISSLQGGENELKQALLSAFNLIEAQEKGLETA